jgi:hypothetical protein
MSLPYSSPLEARARRHARHRSDSGTVYRDRRRSAVDRSSAKLGRDLEQLARENPRFRDPINRLRHHVLVQMRSEEWKCHAVLACLSSEPTAVEEIVEETGLDKVSVDSSLGSLEAKAAAAKCNRAGGAVVIRSDNKPAEKVYWRKAGGRTQEAGGR